MLQLIHYDQVIELFIYTYSMSIFYLTEVLQKIESISQTDYYYTDSIDK